jgi:hypothetical protein
MPKRKRPGAAVGAASEPRGKPDLADQPSYRAPHFPSQTQLGELAGTMAAEQIETRSKKVRGRAKKSAALIDAMVEIVGDVAPVSGRGVGYKLFTAGLIPSMARSEMQRVYRLLREAREEGLIGWGDIVDETRELERTSTWSNPAAFARCVARSYRRDFWQQQPDRVEVWSEKGTVRGVLGPVLDQYAVGFRVMHGFGSATSVHEIAQDDDGRELVALYVGDRDPSGMYMSEIDLPERLERYEGWHVTVRRIAITEDDAATLPAFPASDKRTDPRHDWFVQNFGTQCWELDAMDPRDLRARVEEEIAALIEPVAWERCERVNAAEQESLRTILDQWKGVP